MAEIEIIELRIGQAQAAFIDGLANDAGVDSNAVASVLCALALRSYLPTAAVDSGRSVAPNRWINANDEMPPEGVTVWAYVDEQRTPYHCTIRASVIAAMLKNKPLRTIYWQPVAHPPTKET